MEETVLKRVSEMEDIRVECTVAAGELSAQLERMDALKERMGRLLRYYGSEEWFADREAELPEGTKAGVLSEDLVYDEILSLRDTAIHMLELATDLLKNHI